MRNFRDKVSCVVALGLACAPVIAASSNDGLLGSKTPYAPRQAVSEYEAPPPGFLIEGLQLVARHGSRGLTKPGPELRLQKLLTDAEAHKALTPQGWQLLSAVERFTAAQKRVGYGNLSALGVQEQQQLARRAVARLPGLFDAAAVPAVLLQSSGVDRAVDSAQQFATSLGSAAPKLQVPKAPETDRFLLYFHKLSTERDGQAANTPARQQTLARSQAYQAWVKTLKPLVADSRVAEAARASLAPLLTPEYLSKLSAEEQLERAQDLMDLRGAAADLRLELAGDFPEVLPREAAALFTERDDAEDFSRKGPGLREAGDASYAVAGQLLDAMLAALDGSEPRVRLRFAHAEIVSPLVSRIGVAGVHQQSAEAYRWANNPWRSEQVIPMAANVQWELWRGPEGERLVRMLLNEGEADFMPACEAARWRPGSHFYRTVALRACYAGLK